MKKQLTYNNAMEELESILFQIEKEELDVDKLAEQVKRASYLIQFCKEKLRNTETEVEQILKNLNDSEVDTES